LMMNRVRIAVFNFVLAVVWYLGLVVLVTMEYVSVLSPKITSVKSQRNPILHLKKRKYNEHTSFFFTL